MSLFRHGVRLLSGLFMSGNAAVWYGGNREGNLVPRGLALLEADASHRPKLTAWNKEAASNSPLLPHRVGYANRECLALWRAAGFFRKELHPTNARPRGARGESCHVEDEHTSAACHLKPSLH